MIDQQMNRTFSGFLDFIRNRTRFNVFIYDLCEGTALLTPPGFLEMFDLHITYDDTTYMYKFDNKDESFKAIAAKIFSVNFPLSGINPYALWEEYLSLIDLIALETLSAVCKAPKFGFKDLNFEFHATDLVPCLQDNPKVIWLSAKSEHSMTFGLDKLDCCLYISGDSIFSTFSHVDGRCVSMTISIDKNQSKEQIRQEFVKMLSETINLLLR